MPNHISQRIARLHDLVKQGLFEANLDALVRECSSLAQDTSHLLLFFTLKNIFRELSDALETGAVQVSRYEELTRGISERILSLLDQASTGRSVSPAEMEEVVRIHVVNRNLFRSE